MCIVASLGQFRGINGLQQSEADIRAMKDVPFVLMGLWVAWVWV